MKKLLVALTVVIFAVGLALPAVADIPDPAVGDGYHEVYTWDGTAWVPLPTLERYCEMYSDVPEPLNQYNFASAKGTTPCTGPYQNPEAPKPLQKHFVNYLHLFPWIKCVINQTRLIWDVFKPGNYMSKAFVMALQANCPVLIHFGSGKFPVEVPMAFDSGYPATMNGKIVTGPFEKPDTPENTFDDKKRIGSLLPKGNPGTDPDVVEVWWWWTQGTLKSWDEGHFMTETPPNKGDIGPSPTGAEPTQWVPAPEMNCDYTIINDSKELHDVKFISFYEDIYVEPCDSEGKYIDEFVITICPDP